MALELTELHKNAISSHCRRLEVGVRLAWLAAAPVDSPDRRTVGCVGKVGVRLERLDDRCRQSADAAGRICLLSSQERGRRRRQYSDQSGDDEGEEGERESHLALGSGAAR